MRFRTLKNMWPKKKLEQFLMVFILCGLPAIYYVLMEIILPELSDYGSPGYVFQLLLGVFLFSNVMSNYVMCILVDPSIDPKLMKSQLERGEHQEDWQKCEQCEILAPPGSRHCWKCGVCVLKRDHHCFFTGCCIGHENYRYFFYFLIYFFLSCAISLTSSTIFIYVLHGGRYQLSMLTDLTPSTSKFKNVHLNSLIMRIIYFKLPDRYEVVFTLVFVMLWIGVCVAAYVAYDQWSRGYMCYDFKFQNFPFDRKLRRNFKTFLGRRMRWTWISGFIPSQLDHDGFDLDNHQG
ncbi:probable palmitoyltransferase ZDHHC24 [Drosophila santomea]|uniref:probable palmitoyltransferase ZDHHC24 n=1 Tax=Drosophila santomea TaxID=129105 RepID=UPI001953E3B0|nr:probable palmitoyltransferase ZDHHC24 [Drosophila santomea]